MHLEQAAGVSCQVGPGGVPQCVACAAYVGRMHTQLKGFILQQAARGVDGGMLAVGKLRISILCVPQYAAVSVSCPPSGCNCSCRGFGAPENASKLELRGRVRVLNSREFISTAYAAMRVRKPRSRGLPS